MKCSSKHLIVLVPTVLGMAKGLRLCWYSVMPDNSFSMDLEEKKLN
jgi:hypothetical protein